MSYIVTRTHVRPNTETEWYTGAPIVTAEYVNWMNVNWIQPGKISMEYTFSPDQLTMTVKITCTNEQTWNDLIASPEHIAFQSAKAAWNSDNGITQTTTFATV